MSNRPQIVVTVAILLLASVWLASCTSNSSNGVPSPPLKTLKGPIKIGGTLPLTGPFADTGRWIELGYRYWAEETNGRGGLLGRQVELIIYDDASDSEKAVSLFEQVITQDKVDLLLGGYPGTAAALQMPAAERHRMVYISMGGHMPSFEQGFAYSFGGPPLVGQWWYDGFWQWLASRPAWERPRRMATITVNNIVGLSFRESALDGAARLGIEVMMDELYDLPLTRAQELVAKAQMTGADLFMASGFLPDGVLTIRAMKLLDYNPAFLVQGVGSIVPRWKEELGDDGDYTFSGTPIHAKLPFTGIKELNTLAKSRFGVREAPPYFLAGYAWLQTLQTGVEGVGNLNQIKIRDYLRSHTISTIGGSFTFDQRGLPQPFNYLTQIQPDGVELIWPPPVRTAEPVYPKPPWKHE
jgi:branched-chain amino acid transport system substrate-binding protein